MTEDQMKATKAIVGAWCAAPYVLTTMGLDTFTYENTDDSRLRAKLDEAVAAGACPAYRIHQYVTTGPDQMLDVDATLGPLGPLGLLGPLCAPGVPPDAGTWLRGQLEDMNSGRATAIACLKSEGKYPPKSESDEIDLISLSGFETSLAETWRADPTMDRATAIEKHVDSYRSEGASEAYLRVCRKLLSRVTESLATPIAA